MDSKATQLLWDLRVALVKALTESDETLNVLERLRSEGWAVYLVVDGQNDDGEDAQREALPLRPPGDRRGEEFKIDSRDLEILKSLGIDPTRTMRRRKS